MLVCLRFALAFVLLYPCGLIQSNESTCGPVPTELANVDYRQFSLSNGETLSVDVDIPNHYRHLGFIYLGLMMESNGGVEDPFRVEVELETEKSGTRVGSSFTATNYHDTSMRLMALYIGGCVARMDIEIDPPNQLPGELR